MANIYVCAELADRPNIYGEYACKNWVLQPDSLSNFESLAITQQQAAEITVAIAGVLVVAWGVRLLARMLINANNPFG